jgi:alpha-beta hydrolase superfamily lysophospholipase
MSEKTSYVEEACVLAASGWEIPAALTLPTGRGENAALPSAILLVPGSLFSDVNGDYPTWQSFPHVYAHLARQLSARGHAVYRFAKLGPGTGSVATDPDLAATVRSWDGRLTIATVALDAMRRELEARAVVVNRTIAAGHSEGAVVVSRLAVSERAKELDGVALLAGPSVGILGIMREQIGFGVPPEQLEDARRRLDEAIVFVRRGEPIPAALADGPGMGVGALASMPEEGRRYMREVDATDPLRLAQEMSQPVLVVQGGNDSSVPTHHGEALRDALRGRDRGTTRTEYLFVSNVTHMFKVVPADVSGPAAFGYPGETDARVADGIDDWIRGRREPA